MNILLKISLYKLDNMNILLKMSDYFYLKFQWISENTFTDEFLFLMLVWIAQFRER